MSSTKGRRLCKKKRMTIHARQFFPISRADFDPALKPNQRYRNYFNDLRLEKGVIKLVNGLVQHGSCIIAQCTQQDKDSEQAYRLLSNEDLKLNELIYQLTKVDAQEVAGAELLVPLDASSINLNIGEGVRQNWKPLPIKIKDYSIDFINSLRLENVQLANAFEITNIPYYWKKGKITYIYNCTC